MLEKWRYVGSWFAFQGRFFYGLDISYFFFRFLLFSFIRGVFVGLASDGVA